MAIVSPSVSQFIQITPATGWSAVVQYRNDGGLVSQIYPVLCFALRIDGVVVPLITNTSPAIVDATKEPGYQGMYHSSESAYVNVEGTVVFLNNTLSRQTQEES